MKFEHITVRDGLPENSVSKILQDYQGFLWFATQYGPVKYDGYKFTVYNNNSADTNITSGFSVYSFYEDKLNNLWIATEFGLSRYDREENRLENFSIGNDFYLIYSICEDDYGYLYFGSEVAGTGLYKFNIENKSYTKFLNNPSDTNSIGSNFIKDVFKEDSSTIWIGTIGGGLNKLNIRTQTFTRYKNFPGNRNSISSNNVYSIYKNKSGDIWIGTDNGLNKLDKNSETFTFFSILPKDSVGMKTHTINSIHEDMFGYLWLTVYNYGLVKFEPVTGASIKYEHDPNKSYSLSVNSVETLFEDRSGILWIGSAWGGLNRYDRYKSRFAHFNNIVEDNHSDIVYSILEDSLGNVWVGTSNGLSKFDRKSNSFTNFDKIIGGKKRLTSKDIRKLYIDSKGYFWIGTRDGLNKFDGKKRNVANYLHIEGDTNSLSNNWVRDIYEDNRGNLWIGTSNGLNIFNRDHETFKVYYNNNKDSNSLSNNIINNIYEDRNGDLWFGTDFGGLNKYNREKETFSCFNYPQLGFTTFSSVCEDKEGRFWTGTYMTGMSLFDRKTGAITRFSEKEGLVHNAVYSILEDNSGNLWLGTQNGLSRFNPETNKIRNFDKNDLPFTQFYKGCMKDKSGFLYFGGDGGFIMFHPDSIRDNEHIPEIVLTEFTIFNLLVKPHEKSPLKRNINVADEIILTYDQNMFSLEFAALDYRNPLKNRYAYKLDGFNPDWIYTDARNRTATYTNIDPGEYVFHVKGSNNDGIWNEQGASIRIIITPPWWQTWWFRTAAVFMLAGIFGGSVRYVTIQRYKRRLALEKERSRISRDMHDEVGSSLSKISILSELAKQKAKDPELKGDVEKISESASEVVDNISEIIWAINPKNDTLDNLLAYIREYTGETLEMKNIDYKIELPYDIPPLAISAEARRNIFLVIKEALNNTVKYAQANMVNIFVELSNNRLEITVKDNGIGFDIKDTRMFGNGLINMKKRIEDVRGEFKLDSKTGSGTEIRLSLKLGR